MRALQGDLPSDLRFLPRGTAFHYNDTPKCLSHNCLASFGRDAQGALCVVQLTKLTDQGLRAQTQDGKALHKIQYDIAKGAFVTLKSDPRSNRVLYVLKRTDGRSLQRVVAKRDLALTQDALLNRCQPRE